MVKEVQAWVSEVSGEIFESQREAELLDSRLLEKYNTAALEAYIEEAVTSLRAFFKETIGTLNTEGRFTNTAAAAQLTELYQAAFDSKIARSNRYYNANPLSILAEIEQVLKPGIIANTAVKAEAVASDIENASAEYKKDQEDQGGPLIGIPVRI